MRFAATATLLLAGVLTAPSVSGQEPPPVIRRPQPKAFPASATVSAGLGFGSTRANAYDPVACPSQDACLSLGPGSGWNVGAEFQLPLGRSFGFEAAGQLARPSQHVCRGSQCDSPQDLWAVRGTALLLWRFKPAAPIFFGLGGAVTRFDPSPVAGQDLSSTMEYGAGTAVGYDFLITPQLGGRVAWRSYILAPASDGMPADYTAKGMAWDNAFTFGVRFQIGS